MTKQHIKAPSEGLHIKSLGSTHRLFLAGAIDNGEAEQWQEVVFNAINPEVDVVVYNPRRDDWDANASEEFITEQIKWELRHIYRSNLILVYIPGSSKAPITLLELGIALGMDKNVLVYCEPEYYRYLNVRVTCEYNGINVITDKVELFEKLNNYLT